MIIMIMNYNDDGYNDNKNYFPVQVGDYWVIYLLSKNLNPIAMKELLEELKPVKQKKNKQNMTFGETEKN